jgi:hypothetical protein
MSPHIEQLCSFPPGTYPGLEGDIYLPIEGTNHIENDNSEAAKKSHELAEKQPEVFKEVADDEGKVCEGSDRITLILKKSQPATNVTSS